MVIKFNVDKIKQRYKVESTIPFINDVSSLGQPKNNSLIFCLEYKEEFEKSLSEIKESLILANKNANIPEKIANSNVVIYVNNPRMEYAFILNNFIIEKNITYPQEAYYIDSSSRVDSSCFIEPYVFIGKDVAIGKNCHIKSGVKIYNNVTIGDNCVIGCNTVIGDIGFGIERINDGKWERIPFDGIPMKIPHFGGVIIGSNVEIGALNTIVSGVIDPTIIEDNVMTDDHVHIAHNCEVGDGTLIAAAAELSGGVKIGNNSWIGPNTSIFQKIKIGQRSTVGIGANIFKDMEDEEVYMGIPARRIKKNNE